MPLFKIAQLENMDFIRNLDLTALAVPLFIIFVFVEYVISKWQNKKYHSFEGSMANISIGIAERLFNLFMIGVFYGVFEYVRKNYGLLHIPDNLWTGLLLFIAVDFIWYWYHRLGHEVNIFWAAHIVHHQSDEFNYTVSARITIFQAIIRNVFWCILPLLGFSAESMAFCLMVHGIYPFFIHTRTIGKLGIMEYIFVTPSHHRVHHASNEAYLDKNYGDVLIIWDKLFGTFVEETEEPVYGLTKPLGSYSFLWQHFHHFLEISYAVKEVNGLSTKIKLILSKPDKIKPGIRERLEQTYLTARIYNGAQNRIHLKFYISLQIGISLSLLFLIVLLHRFLDNSLLVAGTMFILLTLINCGAILDQKRWVFYPEIARVILLLITAAYNFQDPFTWMLILIIALLVLFYFQEAEKKFMTLLYGPQFTPYNIDVRRGE